MEEKRVGKAIATEEATSKTKMSEKEYLASHLTGMDEIEKRWYMNAMKTWTKEDYDNYLRFHLWILGDEGERGDGMSFLEDALKMVEEGDDLTQDEKGKLIQLVERVCKEEEITREDENLKERFQKSEDDIDDPPDGGEILGLLLIMAAVSAHKKLKKR